MRNRQRPGDFVPMIHEGEDRERGGCRTNDRQNDRPKNAELPCPVQPSGLNQVIRHPDHELARRILPRGCGAVFTFELKGDRAAGRRFADGLQVFSHLANVGDAKSLAIHPASTTHFRVPPEQLAASGIGQGTLRLSVGLEDPDDLIDDLKRGLKLAQKGA